MCCAPVPDERSVRGIASIWRDLGDVNGEIWRSCAARRPSRERLCHVTYATEKIPIGGMPRTR